MNDEQEPVPSDDAVAEAMRTALTRTVAEEPSPSIEWTAVLSRARRVVLVRRVIATSACAAFLLGATGVALAATSRNDNHHVSVVATGPTNSVETTTTKVEPPVTTVPSTTSSTSTRVTTPAGTPTSTPAENPMPAQPGDFTGQVNHWGDSCDPCVIYVNDKNLQLTIRNNTNHSIDLSPSATERVALICATNMTQDGRLTAPLPPDQAWYIFMRPSDAAGNFIGDGFADTLAPGAYAATIQIGHQFTETGTFTCEGALVNTSNGTWDSETLTVTSRLANVDPYTVEVTSPPTTTVAPTTSTTTP
jgi:hypothetical protein